LGMRSGKAREMAKKHKLPAKEEGLRKGKRRPLINRGMHLRPTTRARDGAFLVTNTV